MTRGFSTPAACSTTPTRWSSAARTSASRALSKTWLLRSRVFGRRGEIVDLKGEYDPLVTALGGTILRLTPGGETRLNPLTRIGRRELREGLLEAIARAMLGRPLSQAEAIGLVRRARAGRPPAKDGAEVCIPDVIEQLRAPGARSSPTGSAPARDDVQSELREVALALQRLCHGPLRGHVRRADDRRARTSLTRR